MAYEVYSNPDLYLSIEDFAHDFLMFGIGQLSNDEKEKEDE